MTLTTTELSTPPESRTAIRLSFNVSFIRMQNYCIFLNYTHLFVDNELKLLHILAIMLGGVE